MLPVLIHFKFDTAAMLAVAYLLAVVITAYSAFSGWRGALGPELKGQGAKKGKEPEFAPASARDKLIRGVTYGLLGAVVSRVALYYMLPASAFLGGKGEGLPLHTYGLLLATGFLSAVRVSAVVAEREWRQDGPERRNQVLDLAFWVLLGGIGGAKLLFMLVNLKETGAQLSGALAHPGQVVDLLSGGLVFQGGFLGALAVSYWYARRHQMDFFRLADVAAPTVSLGASVGRLGCFSAGCCWGDIVPQGGLFGMRFPGPTHALDLFGRVVHTSSLAFESQRTDPRWVVEATGKVFHAAAPHAEKISNWVASAGWTLPVYPTQLFDSTGNLILFVSLMVARRFRRFHGQILGMWLMAYSVLRTVVELFRGDLERGTLHGLLDLIGGASLADKVAADAWYNISTGQFISLCMFGLGASLVLQRGRRVMQRASAPPAAAVSA